MTYHLRDYRKPHLLISLIGKNSTLQKCKSDLFNQRNVCDVSPQPNCGNTCQIYTWYSTDNRCFHHYYDVIMGEIASQITSLTIVYSTVYSDADQSKHQSSASLAFVRGIHRGPVNFPAQMAVTRKMFPFDDVTMIPFQNSEISRAEKISLVASNRCVLKGNLRART